MGIVHAILVNKFALAALVGAAGAAHADFWAFKSWKNWQDILAYDWGVASWRWFQGAVAGLAVSATGSVATALLGGGQ